MKFAHLADVHLGGWREPKLRELNTQSFVYAVDKCISEKVDFVLIAGDLFNTALPSMDALRICVQKLKELKDQNISAYLIPGSHDFSPSGKTMIDILEHAGLAVNVAKEDTVDGRLRLGFVSDPRTGAKITGIFGKKGGLEKHYYEKLNKESLQSEQGTKIFLFHSAIAELMPPSLSSVDAVPVSSMPRGFAYYAGGHIHIVSEKFVDGYGMFVYPGPVFPNSFSELEELGCGSFVIYENGKVRHEKILLHPVVSISVDAKDKTAAEVEKEIQNRLNMADVKNAIVLIRAGGELRQGKPGDINFGALIDSCMLKGAHIVQKNTYSLGSREFEEIKVSKGTVDEIEESIIAKHAGQLKIMPKEKEEALAKELMRILSAEKDEGEKVADFEKRISQDVDKLLGI
ncbi:MAG: exonuclease SbcCD subunit D [Candidatus Woesearchaeota archaeon]